MKKVAVACLILLTVVSCNSQGKRTISGKSSFQRKLNAEYKDASKSPLTKKGLKKFKELDFYPIDSAYVVTAELTKTPDAPIFEMNTTTDRKPLYKKYGILSFSIQGKELELDLFQSQDFDSDPTHVDYLFLPFTDETSGTTSYAGGRFIDLLTTDEQKDGTITIDFNKTYNPYCAYSDRYSCPITPKENHLAVEIKAGVMAYKK